MDLNLLSMISVSQPYVQKRVDELMYEPIIIYFSYAVNFSREIEDKLRRLLHYVSYYVLKTTSVGYPDCR